MSFLAALPFMSGSLSSRARVSFPCLASPSRSCTVSVRSNGWRCSDGRVGVRLGATAMAEVVDDKEDLSASAAARRTAVLTSSSGGDAKAGHCSVFMDAGSHEELVSGIRKVAEAGRIPPNVAAAMEELYHNYKHAVRRSYVGNLPLFYDIEEKIQQTYVAGDRVVTDPLCKPFSMGRNLLCVYSKKHMGDDPELVEKKRKANTRSLKEMAFLLRLLHS
ncbi:hypothetical protein QJS04_geneDACA012173 [Acorus gramineus]|uniref:glycerol-3-phosphate 1-O-acyltransferase n=1 Tax=Acorus gramineus TaxID=55184 RepID=A0AAV9BCV1_ACOGR|nr:hypothetical protein QJS04_geneDACA012173 [Acorus gramineus]